MAVKMRLKRMGKKRNPIYRIVVADSRAPRDGRFIEEVGTYDPNQDPSIFNLKEESVKKWLANGAQPTETVGKLLKIADRKSTRLNSSHTDSSRMPSSA